MQILRWLMLIVLGLLTSMAAEQQPWTILHPERGLTRETVDAPALPADYAAAVAAGTRSADGSPGERYWQNGAAYEFDLQVDPAAGTLAGQGRLTYHNRAPHALRELHLELAQNLHASGAPGEHSVGTTGGLRIERLRLDGRDLAHQRQGAGYNIDDTLMVVRLPEPLAAGASVTVEVTWSLIIPTVGCGGRMGTDREHLVHLAYWYPVFRVYDDVRGWHDAPFLGNGEFHYDLADFDTRITVPRGWLVLGTGSWVELERCLDAPTRERLAAAAAGDRTQVLTTPDTWSQLGFAAGEELTWQLRADQVRDQVLTLLKEVHWQRRGAVIGDRDGDGAVDRCIVDTCYRDTAPPSWADVCDFQAHALLHHGELTGIVYPWPHMLAVEGGGIVGGGMEYPMVTLVADIADPAQLYNVVCHELAHMWWPMLIGIDERRDGWLDEGLTTYTENQARKVYERFPDNDGEAQERAMYRGTASQGDVLVYRPPDSIDGDWNFFISAYAKPATVLAALRRELGGAGLHQALRSFAREWLGKHPYPEDFFATVERVSGRDLGWFWRSWFHEAWPCDHGLWSVRERDGRWQVAVRDWGQAILACRLRIICRSGERLEVRIPAAAWAAGHRFAIIELDPGLVPVAVHIDPRNLSLDWQPTNNSWFAALADAEAVAEEEVPATGAQQPAAQEATGDPIDAMP